MEPEQLVIADADRVQDYVFGTQELRLIRGASALQTELNHESLRELVSSGRGRVISASGGTVVAAFPPGAAAGAFVRAAKIKFAEATLTATISAGVADYPAGRFGVAREQATQRLEAAKNRRTGRPFTGGGPYWATCGGCGLHPAEEFSQKDPGTPFCGACLKREQASDRSAFTEGLQAAPHLDWIGKRARPENYLAFLYIDLDRMGKYLPEHAGDNEVRWRELSRKVFEAVKGAVTKSCRQFKNEEQRAEFEIFLIGGDDAVLALPAHRCFRFLGGFQEVYREMMNGEATPSFSVGMTIAHSHYPIAEFLRISKELLRSAKKIEGVHSIDYEIVTNSMTGRVLKERERVADRGDGRFRTRKPYTLDEFFALETKVRELKTIAPASKIKALYPIAYQGPLQADLEYLSLLSRLGEKPGNALREWIGASLWEQERSGRMTTKAADLAEMWDFVHGTENQD